MNNNWSLITVYLEMQVGQNTVEIPYKIDTGREGNITSLYIFKKTVQRYDRETARKVFKNNIKLKTYNGMHIMQLGTCVILIKFKN